MSTRLFFSRKASPPRITRAVVETESATSSTHRKCRFNVERLTLRAFSQSKTYLQLPPDRDPSDWALYRFPYVGVRLENDCGVLCIKLRRLGRMPSWNRMGRDGLWRRGSGHVLGRSPFWAFEIQGCRWMFQRKKHFSKSKIRLLNRFNVFCSVP